MNKKLKKLYKIALQNSQLDLCLRILYLQNDKKNAKRKKK